ncbi:MAG: sulfotransferase, partial [Chloroflexi bacterium]|nr:sulfotransferase [Chloroflexota bacterium]
MILPSRLSRLFWRGLNTGLHHLETTQLRAIQAPLPQTPIFILGAPRCGSTLFYQVLVQAFDVAYLSNLHCRFFCAPSLVERWLFPLIPRSEWSYRSFHGQTHGKTAPSECAPFWYRFFPRDPQAIRELDEANQKAFRLAIRRFGQAAQRPLLFKNLMNALRLLPLAQALPEALFLVLHRRPLPLARSLLHARKRTFGHYDTWWSARPPRVDELLSLPPHEQVVEQIIAIYEGVDQARAIIGPHRFLDMTYEAFCEDVHGGLETVEAFLSDRGVNVRRREE